MQIFNCNQIRIWYRAVTEAITSNVFTRLQSQSECKNRIFKIVPINVLSPPRPASRRSASCKSFTCTVGFTCIQHTVSFSFQNYVETRPLARLQKDLYPTPYKMQTQTFNLKTKKIQSFQFVQTHFVPPMSIKDDMASLPWNEDPMNHVFPKSFVESDSSMLAK
ncbi:Hypothetical_protein [Hexamita inflata]|uniref:Hypothetical_protein n=1 Tax=Hexamita inflata TaxID=28002 RepID=A0AA86QYK0_9EUKA|nr:Hypothetical protein HINF_LOCUS49853 [Hexamita inflata]